MAAAIIVPKFGGTYQLRGLTTGGGGGGVAFDAISNGTPLTGGSSVVSWTHTPVGTPTAVAVLIGGYGNGSTISGVTYGGVSMSAGTMYAPGGGTDEFTQIFSLANPSSGAQTVQVTPTGGIFIATAAVTVTGSDTVTCFSNSSGSSSISSVSTSNTVTSAAGELVVDCVAGWIATAVASGQGAGQTVKYTDFWNGNLNFGVSIKAGAASVNTTWSTVAAGGTNHSGGSIASFKAP